MSVKLKKSFNETKAINVVLYIAERLKRTDFHKIFKIVYYSDREHLNLYGRTITGDTYIAMQDGPVPSCLYDIFKSVRGDGYFMDDGKFGYYFNVVNNDIIEINQKPDMGELSKTEISCIDDALMKYGDLSWDELREKSHDYAWRSTAINRTIDFANIIREFGGDDDFIDYLKEQSLISELAT